MKHILECTHCERKFEGATNEHARFRLAMHLSKGHGISPDRKKKKVIAKASNTRRQQVREQRHIEVPRYCPCCGTDIGMIAQAMAVAATVRA